MIHKHIIVVDSDKLMQNRSLHLWLWCPETGEDYMIKVQSIDSKHKTQKHHGSKNPVET